MKGDIYMSKVCYEHDDVLSSAYVDVAKHTFFETHKPRYYVRSGHIICDKELAHKYDGKDLAIIASYDTPWEAIRTGANLIAAGLLCKIKNLILSVKDV